MADEEPSSSARPEQKVLLDEHVPSHRSSPSSSSDAEFVDARERSHSESTTRSLIFAAQRAEPRPTSSDSHQAGKGKGKSVDFREPYDARSSVGAVSSGQSTVREPYDARSSMGAVSSGQGTIRQVHEPPEASAAAIFTNDPPSRQSRSPPPVIATTSSDNSTRPVHSRGNSYTNFSRPAKTPASPTSPASPPPGIIRTRNSITALPQRTSSISRTSLNKNRQSGASTIASKQVVQPPVPRIDLERGQKHGSDESAPVPPFAQSLPTDYLSRRKEADAPTTWLTELYTISYLIFFAFFGTLARIGIEWLTFYPGAVITTPVVWANFAGSLVMGFLVEDSRLFRENWPEHTSSTSKAEKRISKQSTKSRRSILSGDFDRFQRKERLKIKAKIPLYVGLTTGFCGCFTSFSLLARDMFLAVSNDIQAPPYQPNGPLVGYDMPRSGGYSFEALLAVIITELTLSIGGFIAGRQLALLFEDYTPRISTKITRAFLDPLIVFLAIGCWVGAIVLVAVPPDRPGGPASAGSWANEHWRGTVLFSLVFAPIGCLSRYYASKYLNKLEPSFPLGTFTVNMLGAAVLAACYDIQHIGIGDGTTIGGGLLSCQALEGLIDGFTGCLTTVSTFVAELDALKRKYAWVYGLSTIVAGFSLMMIIMGPVRWTVGWSNPACAVGYPNKYS